MTDPERTEDRQWGGAPAVVNGVGISWGSITFARSGEPRPVGPRVPERRDLLR